MSSHFESYLGQRCIIKEGLSQQELVEVTFLEVSPAGDLVKVQYSNNGVKTWLRTNTVTVVEVLANLNEDKLLLEQI